MIPFRPSIALGLSALVSATLYSQSLEEKIDNALKFSEVQIEALARREGFYRFVAYTDTNGKWDNQGAWNWCSGFPAGLMWMMYANSGDEKWATYGKRWTEAVRSRAVASDNDTGFQIFCAYGYGLRYASLVLSEAEKDDYNGVLQTATETFTSQRYNKNIGAFRSWPPRLKDPYQGRFDVNMDEMMNLELPAYVAVTTDNAALMEAVMNHGDTSWQNNIFKEGDQEWETIDSEEHVNRQIGSTWHVVGYDPDTGEVISKRTAQGDKTESTWSRGQSWAIYGFAMSHRFTRAGRDIRRAETCFDYYMNALKAQSDDYVPYSDFDAPVAADHPKDTSAAAVVASAAIELYRFTKNEKYKLAAEAILNDLASPPYLAQGTGYESILTKGSVEYNAHEEVGSIFGDFYFVEAMLRYKALINGEEPAESRGLN